jgi:hypothetical protein
MSGFVVIFLEFHFRGNYVFMVLTMNYILIEFFHNIIRLVGKSQILVKCIK